MCPLFLALALLPIPASAQKPVPEAVPRVSASGAECAEAEAEAVLDAAGVRAALYNSGSLFWRGAGATYEVPRGTGRNAVYVQSLMVGGLVGGDLRFTGSTYGRWTFAPGPLSADGTTTPETCAAYDRIWVVTTEDLAAYDAGGAPAADLAAWPVGVGAPFYVDADGDGVQDDAEPAVSLDPGDAGYGTRTLDLAAGERPVIFGRQTAWWVMNDVGGLSGWSDAAPLGVEVRVTAWVHGDAREPDLYESTFYRYEVVNRSAEAIMDVHAGFFVDGDLGNPFDDRVGSDSTRQMLLFYNGDDVDSGAYGYGAVPPAVGFDILSGAAGAITPQKNGAYSGPNSATEAYRNLRSLWSDGTPIRIGRRGWDGTGPITPWAYPGDETAQAYWSQENIDGAGTGVRPADMRGVVAAQPADLAPGERLTFDAAVLFAQEAGRLESVAALRRVSGRAQALYDAGALTRRIVDPADPAPPAAPGLLLPDDGATPSLDEVTFSWGAAPGTSAYLFEILDAPEAAEPLVSQYVFGTSATLDRYDLPLNRTAPVYWRVRALRLGVLSEPSAMRAVTIYTPAFERISVVANASGVLDVPRSGWGWGGPGTEGQQRNGSVWHVDAEGAETPEELFDILLEGDNASRAIPHDFEARFTGSSVAVRASDGAVVSVPFEIWDIGVGTPDDPDDDVRLIPVLHDLDGNQRFSFYVDENQQGMTDPVSWYRPRDGGAGEGGYLRWAADAEVAPRDYGPSLLSRVVFERVGYGSDATRPERGTVFRIETRAQVPPFPASEPEAALALEVRPNPTSGPATVGYRLSEGGRVRLRVVDVLGREVAVLVDEERSEGAHRAALGAGLAPGVYVVVLDAEAGRAARTFTVAR